MGKIAGVLEPRNGKKQTSNEQIKKLFDSGELGRKSRTTTEDGLVLRRSLFQPPRTRESTPANANNSVLAKNPENP